MYDEGNPDSPRLVGEQAQYNAKRHGAHRLLPALGDVHEDVNRDIDGDGQVERHHFEAGEKQEPPERKLVG